MSKKPESNIPLWAIVLGFIVLPPVGFILLFLNLAGVSLPVGTAKKAASEMVNNVKYQQKKQKQAKRGTLMTIWGGILSAAGLLSFLTEIINYGFGFPDDWLPALGMVFGGGALIGFGMARARFAKRWKLYQGAIGQRKGIYISDLANAAGVSEKKVIEDLEKLLADGFLPMGYIDRTNGRLVLTDQGVQDGPRPQPKAEPGANQSQANNMDDSILEKIRAVNDAIPDPVMSAKIDRIGEITGRILDYQRQNPNKAPQLRQFLNYYLPTTLRLLETYANLEAQGVNGENITAAKVRIEGMMDKVVEGFEKQLDQLFQADAMDIAADVEVLEQMLQKDGLGGSGLQL